MNQGTNTVTPAMDQALQQTIQQAIVYHQAGQLQEAEYLYRAILQVRPQHPDANHNLGVLEVQMQQPAASLSYFNAALEASPETERFWISYIDALIQAGETASARQLLARGQQHGLHGEAINTLAARLATGKPEVPAAATRATPKPKQIKPTKKATFHRDAEPNSKEINELLTLFSQGHSAEMETVARDLTVRFPKYGVGWKALGTALIQQGKGTEALDVLQKTVTLLRGDAETHSNLGNALKSMGRLNEAEASYQQALKINPNYAEAHSNLGVTLVEQDRPAEGEACLRRAIKLRPDHAVAHNNLGIALMKQERLTEAEPCFRKALEIKPDYHDAFSNLGSLFCEQGRLTEAETSLLRALEIKPDYAPAFSTLGVCLQQQGRLPESVASLRRALEIHPDSAEALCSLGSTLYDMNRLAEAETSLRRALEIRPDYAKVYSNLGLTLQALCQTDSAVESYQRALELKPDNANAHHNLGFSYLSLGKLGDGWEKYEWRWKVKPSTRPFPQPWWNGSNLTGETILVWGEQGVGDELIFASVLPDVIQAAGHCVVECDPRLAPLFARSFMGAEILPRSNPPQPRQLESDIGFQMPMGNLPRWFRPSLERFPQHHGYLMADPERVAFWKRRLDVLGPGLKVGISWRSRLRHATRDIYYTELSQWGPILTAPGSIFVNLQYDDCRAELEAAREQFGVEIHAWDDIDLMNDLDEAAALTCALDLVISANTSVFSMAGALGKPVWLINLENDWATLGTGAMPWFPDTHLFVKGNAQHNWDTVIGNIAEALKQR